MVPETGVQIDALDAFCLDQIDEDRRGAVRDEHDGEGTSVVLGQVLPGADQLPENLQDALPVDKDRSWECPISLVPHSLFDPTLQICGGARCFCHQESPSLSHVEDQIGNMQPAEKMGPPRRPNRFVPDQVAGFVQMKQPRLRDVP